MGGRALPSLAYRALVREVPVACIALRPGARLGQAEVLALFEGRLARYKHPRDVLFMDALPRKRSGHKFGPEGVLIPLSSALHLGVRKWRSASGRLEAPPDLGAL